MKNHELGYLQEKSAIKEDSTLYLVARFEVVTGVLGSVYW
jgi:hypothetical protein